MLPIYSDSACCGTAPAEEPSHPPRLDQDFVTGTVSTPAGSVPQVSSELRRQDHWGAIKARWGVGRMDYAIDPGLYALGNPDRESPVLVSANYKMSFDRVAELPARQECLDPGPRYEGDQCLVRRRKGDLRDGGTGQKDRSERLERGRQPPVGDPSPIGGAGCGRPHGEKTLRLRCPLSVRSRPRTFRPISMPVSRPQAKCASRPSRSRRGPS